jgi:hypothetical protein
MAGPIYHLDVLGNATALENRPYDAEATLQKLLADHPEVLAGEQTDAGRQPKWLLIQREMPVPGKEGGSGKWSLDHLFLDQDAVPTFVEVKRSTNRELRREVVAQMLDYAANAVAYWPPGSIRERFLARCLDADQVFAEFTDTENADKFWEDVDRNLKAGKIRMVFVADEIPPELRRIVEFLNEQMISAEVLAIEVKQYVGGGMITLVPTVIGQTEAARMVKDPSVRTRKQWDKESFFAKLLDRRGLEEAQAAERLLDWATRNGLRIWWGQGQVDGSFFPIYDNHNGKNFLFAVWSSGRVEIQFQYMNNSPFDDEAKRRELAERISEVSGEPISHDRLSKRPSITLASLLKPGCCDRFLDTFTWALDEIKQCESPNKSAASANTD